MSKILCPFHQDTNPSMHLYAENAYCFVCGKTAKYDEIGQSGVIPPPSVEPEDINAAMRRIESLNRVLVRGLRLFSDERGYYIVWPGDTYYKYRLFKGPTRYLAPRGHKQPLLTYRTYPAEPFLILVEGEINALSILMTQDETYTYDVSSPGASGNFMSLDQDLLELAAHYKQVVIWTDHDPAGIKALWHIYPKLVKLGIKVTEYTSTEDANDILVKKGPPGLRAVIERLLGGNNEQQTNSYSE